MSIIEIWFFFGAAAVLALVIIFTFAFSNAGEMFAAAKRFTEVAEGLTAKKTITQGQAIMYLGNAVITAATVFGALYFLAKFIEAFPDVAMLVGG